MDSGNIVEAKEDGSIKTGNISQELLVSVVKEKVHVETTKPSSSFAPSTSASKKVNPFSKVGEILDSDSDEEEVVNPFDESVNLFNNFPSSTGGGHELEYDYDDYADQVYDLPEQLETFYDMYDIKVQGPFRK